MKTLLLISILSATACVDGGDTDATNHGAGGKADDFVETDIVVNLPVLGAPRIVFEPAPDLAAVQPTASLHFTYRSCSKRVWTVNRKVTPTAEGDRTLVLLEEANVDCFGPSIERAYAVQVTSDAAAERDFVVVNPTAMTFAE
jgi:hypothetical protein